MAVGSLYCRLGMAKPKKTWEYEGTLIRVIDGDTAIIRVVKTITQEVDFGFNVKDTMTLVKEAEVSFRFHGINTPELYGPEKVKALAAKAEVQRLLSLGKIRVVSLKADKYSGRWVAELYVTPPKKAEIWVNKALLDGGFAVPYDGKGKK